jgi:hypothetical protein
LMPLSMFTMPWGKTVDSQDRLILCQAMNDAIRSHQGHGFQALLPFIVVDPDPQVVANAALKTAILFPARHRDPLEGARFVARLARVREHPKPPSRGWRSRGVPRVSTASTVHNAVGTDFTRAVFVNAPKPKRSHGDGTALFQEYSSSSFSYYRKK